MKTNQYSHRHLQLLFSKTILEPHQLSLQLGVVASFNRPPKADKTDQWHHPNPYANKYNHQAQNKNHHLYQDRGNQFYEDIYPLFLSQSLFDG
jgi:hypothetical protein